MFLQKRVAGFAVLFALILAITTAGPLSAFAEIVITTQPIESRETVGVELRDDFFNPKVINLRQGRTTKVVLKNNGTKEHTFTVQKLGIDAVVPAGQEKTITVKANQPGTYELICRYHFQEGMVGTVIVK
ncbi:cupredoxin domain-containing protein [Neobacillus notoginsengisoli]|uniref:Cupredoxin domain-containing protein n=1 Tax=Neobacillus notoginsengisoli TaxID=1578198 RepID=A0A417YSW4_9BACI|nr:cupredoxin domain-containing protein [Neobacillus notoginsengisoli]RHW39081.1 cupredoxin domain-containing protein [Neobacillus notoginsengisoli]